MKILVIGLGSIARRHIRAIRTLDPAAEIYALRHDPNAQKEDGVVNIFTRQEAAHIGADFAIISNPTAKHREAIDWLAELSIPLFIEKPLSENLNMEDVLEKLDNTLTYVACNMRFLGCVSWIAKNIGSKTVNEVNAYCGSYLPEWRQGADWRKTYSAVRALGGGVHIDLIHEIDYIYHIFGRPNTVHKVLRSSSSLGIDSIDYANYCLEYDNFAASIILNYYRRDYRRTLEIVMEDETWMVDLAQNKVSCAGEVLFDSDGGIEQTYISQMQYFMGLVKDGSARSENPIREAYEVLKICLEDETGK